MASDRFSNARKAALFGDDKNKGGRPRNPNIQHGDPTTERLPKGYRRVTYHMREDLADRLRDIAYTDRLRLQDLVNDIIEAGVKQIEADHKIEKAPVRMPRYHNEYNKELRIDETK